MNHPVLSIFINFRTKTYKNINNIIICCKQNNKEYQLQTIKMYIMRLRHGYKMGAGYCLAMITTTIHDGSMKSPRGVQNLSSNT